jgi:hypothetical protein
MKVAADTLPARSRHSALPREIATNFIGFDLDIIFERELEGQDNFWLI